MSNDLNEKLKKAEAECKELFRYWDDISWFERDIVIDSMMDFFRDNELKDISYDMRDRIDEMLHYVLDFQMLNAPCRPSRLQLLLDRKRKLRFDGQERPQHTVMMNVIKGLTYEQQCELADYVGVNDRIDICESLAHAGDDSSVRFFALRGMVGRLHMEFTHG